MVVPVNMLVLTAAYMMVNMLMNIILNSQNLIYNRDSGQGVARWSEITTKFACVGFIYFISLNS